MPVFAVVAAPRLPSLCLHRRLRLQVIKRRIEALIEREYLERDEERPNSYKYLA